jgi:RNA polymerase sigma factor for flagellar operon FliA
MDSAQPELSEGEKEMIINKSLPFIKYTAYRLSHRLPPQLSVNDLISVGIVGLLDALKRYSAGRAKLNTFTEYRIKGAMLDELRAQDWIPRSLKQKIGLINKTQKQLQESLGRVPSGDEVADSLDITLDEYYRTIESASHAVVSSFEDLRGPSWQEGDLDVMECIPDTAAKSPLEQCEENSIRNALAELIDQLPEKERLVLSLYYWEELTMKEIGRVLQISEGRVCQLHSQAILTMKSQMSSPVPA